MNFLSSLAKAAHTAFFGPVSCSLDSFFLAIVNGIKYSIQNEDDMDIDDWPSSSQERQPNQQHGARKFVQGKRTQHQPVLEQIEGADGGIQVDEPCHHCYMLKSLPKHAPCMLQCRDWIGMLPK